MSGTQIRPERLREFGVAGYLPKPVSMALLMSCVNRLINEPGAVAPAESSEVLG
jgi:DNA-binding NarL/FixJ family response regulator